MSALTGIVSRVVALTGVVSRVVALTGVAEIFVAGIRRRLDFSRRENSQYLGVV